jgi:hypothetical protein
MAKAKPRSDKDAAAKVRLRKKLTEEAFTLAQQAYTSLVKGRLLEARESLYAVVMRLGKVCGP